MAYQATPDWMAAGFARAGGHFVAQLALVYRLVEPQSPLREKRDYLHAELSKD